MTAPRCIQTFRHAEGQTKHVNNFTFFVLVLVSISAVIFR